MPSYNCDAVCCFNNKSRVKTVKKCFNCVKTVETVIKLVLNILVISNIQMTKFSNCFFMKDV